MIVYKVVNNEGGKLYSAVVVNPIVRLEYIPNEWTESKFGPIYCFLSLEDAKKFVFCESTMCNRLEIWKALVNKKDERAQKYFTNRVFHYNVVSREVAPDLYDEDLYFFSQIKNKRVQGHYDYPKGSAAYKKIKLLENI